MFLHRPEYKAQLVKLLTIVFAFCSIMYELLLAQSLSSTMGNTILRYNMTIGLYVAAMGFGAIIYSRLDHSFKDVTFIKVETLLAILGFFAPFLVLIFDSLMFKTSQNLSLHFYSSSIQWPIFFFNHFLIIAIGFLSGYELPMLMDMYKQFSKKSSMQILAVDYVGTLLGALCFPLLILPYFSIFKIGCVIAMINVFFTMFYIRFFCWKKGLVKYLLFLMTLFLLIGGEVVGLFSFEKLVMNNFYYR
ncbi:MAG: hypothetical protein L6Q33_10995 [Bacteriovoracaceae bacterium]|nr:hypothetical protein [Bacteriovoracaceae bacterium]